MCGGGSRNWNNGSSGSNGSGDGRNTEGVPPEKETNSQAREETENPCLINETIELDSTDPDALDDVSEGDILPIEVRDGVPSVIDDEDRVVGTITGDLGERLLDCIENDYSYRAEIIEIDGRKCEVRIINKCYITSTATIASPNPDALSKVSEGDVLAVKVRDDSLCVVDDQDKVVGSIAKPWTKILIECVESGVEYEAGVTDIDGGACEVEVYNKSSEE